MTHNQHRFACATIGAFIGAFIIIYLFNGCAPTKMNAPSAYGVNSGIGRVGTSVSDARKSNDLAVIHNKNASTRVERIDAKAKVIQQYWDTSK